MTPWLTRVRTKNVDEFVPTRVPQAGWHRHPATDSWGRKGWRAQGQHVLLPELLMTHGKFRTSVLCLLHTATNLPSAFSASSPSSLQSMWPVSKRARLFKYCSAPLTYSKPPCASPLPRGEGPPFCTCRSKWQPTPILAGRAWRATVHGVTKSWTQLSACARTRVHTHTHTHTQWQVRG